MQWFRGRSVPAEDQWKARLRRVSQNAMANTRYARNYPRAWSGLDDLPKVDLLEFLCHPERYSLNGAPRESRQRLMYPLGNPPRTAVIGRKVEESRRVRCFSSLYSEGLDEFAPQTLAAPVDALRAVTGEPTRPLRNAVIVFSGILEGPLTPADADSLWQRYQVPVFEQFLGFSGELLAWECEIHHGLHVKPDAAVFEVGDEGRLLVSFLANPRLPLLRLETGLSGNLVNDRCPCGDPAPRLVDLRRRTVRRAPVAEALAAAVS